MHVQQLRGELGLAGDVQIGLERLEKGQRVRVADEAAQAGVHHARRRLFRQLGRELVHPERAPVHDVRRIGHRRRGLRRQPRLTVGAGDIRQTGARLAHADNGADGRARRQSGVGDRGQPHVQRSPVGRHDLQQQHGVVGLPQCRRSAQQHRPVDRIGHVRDGAARLGLIAGRRDERPHGHRHDGIVAHENPLGVEPLRRCFAVAGIEE